MKAVPTFGRGAGTVALEGMARTGRRRGKVGYQDVALGGGKVLFRALPRARAGQGNVRAAATTGRVIN
jgi:hypothetical protein